MFNSLGQKIAPALAARIFPDRLSLFSSAQTQDAIGGTVFAAAAADHSNIPCAVAAKGGEGSITPQGEKLTSEKEFIVNFPSHTAAGAKINFDPAKHTIVVAARGNEPQKTLRVTAVDPVSGVIWRVECVKEN